MLNISEPTYLTVFNNTDYFALDGQFYKPEEIRNDPDLLAKIDFDGDGVEDIDIDPVPIANVRYASGGVFWTDAVTIQPRNYTRIAVLVDSQSPIPLVVQRQFPNSPLGLFQASVQPMKVQLTRDPPFVSVIEKTRGFYRWYLLYLYKNWGAQPSVDAIDALEDVVPDPGPTEASVVVLQ
jgi:hypothetical protein